MDHSFGNTYGSQINVNHRVFAIFVHLSKMSEFRGFYGRPIYGYLGGSIGTIRRPWRSSCGSSWAQLLVKKHLIG